MRPIVAPNFPDFFAGRIGLRYGLRAEPAALPEHASAAVRTIPGSWHPPQPSATIPPQSVAPQRGRPESKRPCVTTRSTKPFSPTELP